MIDKIRRADRVYHSAINAGKSVAEATTLMQAAMSKSPSKTTKTQYRGYTLTQRPDGKVDLLSNNKPGALLVTRDCMAYAIEFIDWWTMTPEDYTAKYGPHDDDDDDE